VRNIKNRWVRCFLIVFLFLLLFAGVALTTGSQFWGDTFVQHERSSANISNPKNTFEQDNIIVVGIDALFPPYEFIEEGQPTGYNVDLIRAVSRVMGFSVEIRYGPWAEIRTAFENGEIDVLAGLFFSEERDKIVDFSTAHNFVAPGIFLRDNSSVSSLEDLTGKQVIVQDQDIIDDELTADGRFELIRVDAPVNALRLLAGGEYDAVVLSSKYQGLYYVDQLGLSNLKAIDLDFEPRSYHFAVLDGRSDLLLRLNEGLNILRATGESRQLYEHWFGLYEPPSPWERVQPYLGIGGAILIIVIAMILLWVWSLRQQVQNRTIELQESEERYRYLVEKAVEGVLVLVGQKIVFSNPQAQKITGYTGLDLEEMQFTDLIYSADLEKVIQVYQSNVVGKLDELTGPVRIMDKNKNIHWANTHFSKIRWETTSAILLFFSDISEQKFAEDALREREETFRLLYEEAPLSYLALDENGNIVNVNKVWESTFGYEFHQVVGRWFGDLLNEESANAFQRSFENYKDEQSIQNAEFVALRKDGENLIISMEGRVSHDIHGNFKNIHCILHDVTGRKKAEDRLRFMASHDALTKLPNRSMFSDRLSRALARASRFRQYVAVMFMDLDGFKSVNDAFGHKSGDLLLQIVANRLRQCVREIDTVARMGGDEFAILLEGISKPVDVTPIAEKILASISAPFLMEGNEVFVTTSVGISIYPTNGDTPKTLLQNADTAMYRAKHQGKNNYQFYSIEMAVRALERLSLGTRLRHAVDRNELTLFYQPIIELERNKTIGVEALIRWRKFENGLVSPKDFIPLAEETGLIQPIGEWVLLKACEQILAWQRVGYPAFRVSVNLSARQFNRHSLIPVLNRVLEKTKIDPALLELELSENIVFRDIDETLILLQDLKKIGVRLAIDDFGTGYSTLNQLARFPFDVLKIDQIFAKSILENEKEAAVVSGIISIASELGLAVVAEGVETKAQLDFYRSQGCRLIQGYYFSRPLPPEAMEIFIKEKQKV
jgi:diguanylate cyclase (GGDEF)-like protein/PAS domain S-box-containing protein